MTSTPQRTPYERQHRQSIFFSDISSPLPSSSSPFLRSSPSPIPSTPPPPPVLSLSDDPSPSHDFPFYIPTPEPLTPDISSRSLFSAARENCNSGYGGSVLGFSSASGDGRMGSPMRTGSPVEGLLKPGVGGSGGMSFLTLPPPREVVRPEMKREEKMVWELDEEMWVTVFGFAPSVTNLVLREFEKCGEILRWVPGPNVANWIHILYKSRFDAQKALAKHGMKLNNLLIIGVKRVDPLQLRFLNESETHAPLPLSDINADASGRVGSALIPFNFRSDTGNNNSGMREMEREGFGAVAAPSKSVISRVLDIMFGI